MQQFEYTVQDALGIHARPAGLLVKLIKTFGSRVTVTKGGESVDALRLIGLMKLGVKQGDTVTVQVEGDDEALAAAQLEAFFKENL